MVVADAYRHHIPRGKSKSCIPASSVVPAMLYNYFAVPGIHWCENERARGSIARFDMGCIGKKKCIR
jgi:hypothetical protein